MKPINFLNLKCGYNIVNGQKVRNKEQIYTIRLLPHATHEGTRYAFRRSIKRHRLPNGSEVVCNGHNCPYCAENIKAYITNYIVVELFNSTSDFSHGIYVLVFDYNFAIKLKHFEDTIRRDFDIDISSLYDDGCFFNVRVFKNTSGKDEHEFSIYTKGRYSEAISGENDIISFVNSESMPELDKFIKKETSELEQKDESFFDSILSAFADNIIDDEFDSLSRNFDPYSVATVTDAFTLSSKNEGDLITETVEKNTASPDFDEFLSNFGEIFQ